MITRLNHALVYHAQQRYDDRQATLTAPGATDVDC